MWKNQNFHTLLSQIYFKCWVDNVVLVSRCQLLWFYTPCFSSAMFCLRKKSKTDSYSWKQFGFHFITWGIFHALILETIYYFSWLNHILFLSLMPEFFQVSFLAIHKCWCFLISIISLALFLLYKFHKVCVLSHPFFTSQWDMHCFQVCIFKPELSLEVTIHWLHSSDPQAIKIQYYQMVVMCLYALQVCFLAISCNSKFSIPLTTGEEYHYYLWLSPLLSSRLPQPELLRHYSLPKPLINWITVLLPMVPSSHFTHCSQNIAKSSA